jgi:hypothetical protein
LVKLTKTGAPFTVENVCDLAGVGKTFIYDKRRPELTKAVLAARACPKCGSWTTPMADLNELQINGDGVACES